MSHPTAPADVIRAVAAGVCRLIAGGLTEQQRQAQLDDLAALYAERTDVQHPFNPLGDTPLRTRTELREHFAAVPASVLRADRFDAVGEVHLTADPEVVIFELRYVGEVDGREFSVPCIFVARIRDGEIVESRDYAHHIGMARTFGSLNELAAALAA